MRHNHANEEEMIMLDTMLNSYIETALWSSTDDDGEALDGVYSRDDLADETVNQMRSDCEDFLQSNGTTIEGLDASRVGHDFWLTRNRHGAGFWDGDYAEPVGKALTDASHVYGEVNLYVGDDGLIYQA
jgi:hypothetical protein